MKLQPSVSPSINTKARLALTACALGVVTVTLPGCFPVLATGVVVGAMSVSDRRTTGAQTEDQAIEIKAFNHFRDKFKSDKVSLSVTSFNRTALLTGYVPTEADKTEAARIVATIENVRTVLNEIHVGLPPSFRTYGSDSVLTTRIKASMIEAKDLQANAIKVFTETSTVYLMGIVTEREASRAADIASRVVGVRRVVRAFEVVSEAELARIQAKSAEPAKPAPTPAPPAPPPPPPTPAPITSATPAASAVPAAPAAAPQGDTAPKVSPVR